MLPKLLFILLAGFSLLAGAAPAAASDEAFELWINPSAAVGLDADTHLEIETAQRLRSRSDDRADTYYARLWLNQDVSDQITLSGGFERRVNDPGADETRFLQQLSTAHGILRTRFRVEQRFVDNGRLGLRFRPRLGVDIPLAASGDWSMLASAELFVTLRSTSAGGRDGLTGVRTQLGASYAVNDALSITIAYLRQQDIESGAPDRVGHAPLVGIELGF